jgi:hypothetical protein
MPQHFSRSHHAKCAFVLVRTMVFLLPKQLSIFAAVNDFSNSQITMCSSPKRVHWIPLTLTTNRYQELLGNGLLTCFFLL